MSGAGTAHTDQYSHLASYQRCVARVTGAWPAFVAQRSERLRQGLFGTPVEKVAENILEDLFTKVLDWDLGDVDLQVGRADIVLSELGIKRLVLEVKRPGSLAWHRHAVESALCQAMRYAAEQKVGSVAVSDGQLLYAADIAHGGLKDRLFVALDSPEPPLELWWLSVHGIYRACPTPARSLPQAATTAQGTAGAGARAESCSTTCTSCRPAASPTSARPTCLPPGSCRTSRPTAHPT